MENLPTLRQLQYLVALDDHKSFHRAAEECHVTQSTLSGGLRDMEDILRAPVIDRSNRRQVRLTALGQDVLRTARAVIGQMEDITRHARKLNEPLALPLRLGVIPTIAPYLLPRILQPLQAAFPRLELHIHEVRSAILVERVQSGLLDLGLMAFPYEVKGLKEYPMIGERFVCAAPETHFKGKQSLVMDDLRTEKLLLLEDGHCLRDHALQACHFQPDKEMKTFSASSLSTILQMVAQGYGVTMIPDMVIENGQLPKGVKTLPFRGNAPKREIGLVWNEKGPRQADIAMIADSLYRLLNGKMRRTAKNKHST